MKIKVFLVLISVMVFFSGFLFGQACPEANFTYSHYCSVSGVAFTFNATNYEADSDFVWYFGDGDSAVVNNFNFASHLYATPGIYTVTLKQYYNPTCPVNIKSMPVYVYDSEVQLTASATTVLVNTPIELSFTALYSSITPVYRLDIAGTLIDPVTSPYYWTPTVAGPYTVIVRGSYPSAGGPSLCFIYDTVIINVVNCPSCSNIAFTAPSVICVGNPAVFSNLPTCTSGVTFLWDFGDGVTSNSPTHTYTAAGSYLVQLKLTNTGCGSPISGASLLVVVTNCPNIGCDDCIGSFAPIPGDYMVGTWVKQANGTNLTTYANAGVKISFVGSGIVYGPFMPDPTTKIIDGWQRVESPKWAVPVNATQIIIELINTWTSAVFFDDIRIQPFDSNMKTYVYDPITLRLAAELDENNYATFYEYDEDGALIRVKKETERGIVTIKETRNNNKK